MEKWLPIPGFENRYEASTHGRIKSVSRYVNGKHGKNTKPIKETILKHKIDTLYLRVTLYNDGIKKTFLVHRLVADTFIPNPNNFPMVLHKDDNPLNNNVDNLMWGTPLDNMTDKTIKGRQTKGIDVHTNKLTEEQVLEIRSKFIPYKYTYKMLAKEYNVSIENINSIVNRKYWKHI